jgi:hypothetical protein
MRNHKILIQQDNASPHKVDKVRFQRKAAELKLNVAMYNQPAQSPDTNVCDLSFFRSLQSSFYKKVGIKSLKDIIRGVKEAWDAYQPYKIDKAFLTLLLNYNEILKNNGGNNYKLPHMGKDSIFRKGILPVTFPVVEYNDNNNNNNNYCYNNNRYEINNNCNEEEENHDDFNKNAPNNSNNFYYNNRYDVNNNNNNNNNNNFYCNNNNNNNNFYHNNRYDVDNDNNNEENYIDFNENDDNDKENNNNNYNTPNLNNNGNEIIYSTYNYYRC